MKYFLLFASLLFLFSCNTKETMDLSNTPMFIEPLIKVLNRADQKPIFTDAQRAVVYKHARKNNIAILIRVVIDKEGNVIKVRSKKMQGDVSQQIVTNLNRDTRRSNFADLIARHPNRNTIEYAAFYIPWSINYEFR